MKKKETHKEATNVQLINLFSDEVCERLEDIAYHAETTVIELVKEIVHFHLIASGLVQHTELEDPVLVNY